MLAFVDLDHGAIDDQFRVCLRHAPTNRVLVRDIELAVLESHDLMFPRQPLRQVAADESGRSCNKNPHCCRL